MNEPQDLFDPDANAQGDWNEWTRRNFLQLAGSAIALAATPMSRAATLVSDKASASVESLPATTLVDLTINGQPYHLQVDPRISLLDVLREQLALTGTKKGCNQGACGACTVLLDDKRVNSCLTLAVMHQGARITTIEGLASGTTLHPLQSAFIEHDGFQCGYCTSGQIMSGIACIAEGHAHSVPEIKAWMSGNICRCGAYAGICAAIAQTATGVNPTERG